MFGIHYIKATPTQHIIHYQGGRKKRSGTGLSFFYFRPSSSIVLVPANSADVPYIFNEISADFQPLSVQGQLTYRINQPEQIASLLDYSITPSGKYVSDDPQKLPVRLVNLLQVSTRAEIQRMTLKEAVRASQEIASAVLTGLKTNSDLDNLGVEVLAVTIEAIRPTPETSRALEAEAREGLLRRADQAIYERRNSAVEQERLIKENELSTEIAIEEKKRQIRETKVNADLAVEAKEQQVRESKLTGQIKLEEDRTKLVAARTQNARTEADAQAYAIEASIRPLRDLDPEMLQMLSVQSVEPRLMVSMALKEIAKNAGKINNLNISPDLLNALMAQEQTK
jgi:regulator of protease activity HflC (stomatin/prohibitin superfamily)